MKPQTHEMIWDVCHSLSLIGLYVLIITCSIRQAWLEGLFWLGLLAVERLYQIKSKL